MAGVTIEMNCDREVQQDKCYHFHPHSCVQTPATHASFEIWKEKPRLLMQRIKSVNKFCKNTSRVWDCYRFSSTSNVTSACYNGDRSCLETALEETSGVCLNDVLQSQRLSVSMDL